MEKVMNYFKEFFGGLVAIMMAILPVAILWQVLTGTMCFGMDVIANLTDMITAFGTSGFVGLIALIIVMSFFVKK